MPRRTQQVFWRHKLPDPMLIFDPSFPNTGAADRALRRKLENAFREAQIDLNDKSIEVRDFFGVIIGMHLTIEQTRHTTGFDPEVVEFLHKAGPRLTTIYRERLQDALAALLHSINVPLVAASRLDQRLLFPQLDTPYAHTGKVEVRVTLAAQAAKVERITLDNAARSVYRAAQTTSAAGLRWISWMPGDLGIAAPRGSELPVYVQNHALRQLHSRIDLPAAAPYIEYWMCASLEEPNIVERYGNDFLVEYRLRECRMGYLIATLLERAVVVRTFKFLTMQGTPEARKLEKRLGLSRGDIDWLRLHELSSFTKTDLRQDTNLRALLTQCGCGQLFELDAESCAQIPQSAAAEMRRYLGMAA
jgi:hypothetical protein